jgi:hypothetical protein
VRGSSAFRAQHLEWILFWLISDCILTIRKGPVTPTGPEATALKRRKRALLARLRIPPDALPGSLALTQRRCGKSSCHCAKGAGHPFYSLTFMVDGKKHVESIPLEWVDVVRPAVDSGRGFKDAIAELFVINAQLLVLSRQQRRRRTPANRSPE